MRVTGDMAAPQQLAERQVPPPVRDRTFVFFGGLHRSGTSLLSQCLSQHPMISGLTATGAPEDEGQHVQSVYPPARAYGGAGKFAFRREAHLTEVSALASERNGLALFYDWSRYWDTTKSILVEKSPPNLIRGRFLQKLFPNCYFVFVVRHPVAVCLATQKWSRSSLYSLFRHWVLAHEIFKEDLRHIRNALVVKYEHFVVKPDASLKTIYDFIGVPCHPNTVEVDSHINAAYLATWQARRRNPLSRLYIDYLADRFEDRVGRFGYSLSDLERCEPWP